MIQKAGALCGEQSNVNPSPERKILVPGGNKTIADGNMEVPFLNASPST